MTTVDIAFRIKTSFNHQGIAMLARLLLIPLLFFFSIHAPAQIMTGNPLNPNRTASPSKTQSDKQKKMTLASLAQDLTIEQTKPGHYILACPEPSKLVKNPSSNRWEVTPYWKSFQVSLTRDASIFLGAQWTGAGVGNLVCIYQSSDVHYCMCAHLCSARRVRASVRAVT